MMCYQSLCSIDLKKDKATFFLDLNFSSLDPTFQYSTIPKIPKMQIASIKSYYFNKLQKEAIDIRRE